VDSVSPHEKNNKEKYKKNCTALQPTRRLLRKYSGHSPSSGGNMIIKYSDNYKYLEIKMND
jgi:hypothetical protein